ncbi:hypothetical protein ACVGWV_00030, partial [Enterobacter asburiae]
GHLTASTVIQYRGAIIPREAMAVKGGCGLIAYTKTNSTTRPKI